MSRDIKILIFQGFLVFGIVLLLASFAQASSGHHAHRHAKAYSPFGKINSDKPLHCLLNSHFHKTMENCPHKSNPLSQGKSAEFRPDCGSNPVGSGGISFGNDLPQGAQSGEFTHHLVFQFIPLRAEGKLTAFCPSIDRPPQLS